MANSSLDLSSLDFDSLKGNLKTFLSTQFVFRDYNFDGSNINVLLDVLSYNSYLNSFYLNMVASEMFLDSAQKYESVISHAKELNYLPQSARSSEAQISFTFDTTGISGELTLEKGTQFSGYNSNGTYTFITDLETSYTSANSTFSINGLKIYEGSAFQDSFLVDYTIENQRFLISNKNVDINSLVINVIENNGSTNTVFQKAENLFGLSALSEVYFLQGAENNQYEVVFGDGLFGRKPLNAATILVNYRVTNGSDALGVDNFTLVTDVGTLNGGIATESVITVDAIATSGANQESIDSIRFSAPRYFATQQRAVASDDYSSLVLSQFGNQIDDVNVYGGELLEPKQYGKVVIAVKQTGGTIVPDYLKTEITNYLTNYIALPNRVSVVDPDYFYVGLETTVQYDKNATTKLQQDIVSVVRTAINKFATANIGKFGSDFRYSKIVAYIDNSDASITSNDTHLQIIKRLTPKINTAESYVVDFNNGSEYDQVYAGAPPLNPILRSSSFSYTSTDGTAYSICNIQDDGFGNLILYTYINNRYTILSSNIGTIDYVTGLVKINNLKVTDYTNYISLYYLPNNKDIIMSKDKILLLELSDVTVTAIETVK